MSEKFSKEWIVERLALAEQRRERVAELEKVLREWLSAWDADVFELRPNGVTCYGVDEGIVRGGECMSDIVEHTRKVLEGPRKDDDHPIEVDIRKTDGNNIPW